MYTIAVDIGGTFTDVIAIDDDSGRVTMGKALTTPDDLQQGVFDGLADASRSIGCDVSTLLGRASRMVHATTQSSNAVFSFTGARTAVLTTAGFGDTLTIMRATGRVAGLSVFERHHYRATRKPRLLVDERDVFEIAERVDAHGEVITPLDEDQVAAIARTLVERGYQAVAVCYLFAHQNRVHETRTGDILKREAPGLYVSLSADIAPVMGEYERSATALFNAYVGPVIDRYLARLEAALADAGLRQKLLIVQANGGLATVSQTVPIFTIESGPAAGVVGAAHLARELGHPNLIATDVGGTTFKVAVIRDGAWSHSAQTVLNQYQLRLPMIDLTSIGAGGGSIAWVDGGRLRIGPRSAAAQPGPACYGQGGSEPTVTDADLVLGYISPSAFLGGRMKLHPERAFAAIRDRIAIPLFGGDVIAAAAGIRTVVDSQMADLIRKSTLERGYDPREFTMMAYGGAGPVHAASYAAEAGASRLIVPFFATVHSAYGAALSDIRFSLQFSEPIVLHDDPSRIEAIFAAMTARGDAALAAADVPAPRRAFHRWVEARYRRQVHQLRIPVPPTVDRDALPFLARAFEREYERLFGAGSGLADAGIELINYGVDAIGRVDKAAMETIPEAGRAEPSGRRPIYCGVRRAMVDAPVYDGPGLPAGARIEGPAIIEHPGTTIVLHARQSASVDVHRHTHIDTGVGQPTTVTGGQ